jgi:hypothetical protein
MSVVFFRMLLSYQLSTRMMRHGLNTADKHSTLSRLYDLNS